MANNNHFELTLDTLAPSGAIHPAAGSTKPEDDPIITNVNVDLTIDKDDASHMKVWKNENATGTKEDAGYTGGEWITAAGSFKTEFTVSEQSYYHLVLRDNVGNESAVYNTKQNIFDNVAPVVSGQYLEDKDSGSKDYTNEREVKYYFEFSDAAPSSGVTSGRIVGDCTAVSLTNMSSPMQGTLMLTEGDGSKVVTFYVTDAAGNESVGKTATIYLDTHLDAPVLTIHKASDDADISAQFVNYGTAANQIKACITTEEDVKFYKFWKENETEPTDWTAFVPAEEAKSGVIYMYIPTQVSSGDGQKNFYIRVKDQAGTVYPAEGQAATTNFIKLDQTVPTVTLTRTGAEWISNVAGHNASELTLAASDAYAGVKSWELKCNGSKVDGGNGDIPAAKLVQAITSATVGMVEGSNTFVLEIVDNAENSNSASAVVKLDVTVPTASITQLNAWYNAEFSIQANTSDSGSGMNLIYAWTSMTAGDESCPSTATGVAWVSNPQTIAATDIKFQLQQSADNYMHIKAVDVVGNVTYAHCKFGFDNVAPTDNGSAFDKAYYNVVTAQVNLAYTDATSGVAYMKVTNTSGKSAGITNPSEDWEAVAATKAVTLTTGDGEKWVSVQFKDNAGNVSSIVSFFTELDTTAPAALHELHVAGGDAAKPSYSNVPDFDAWIAFTDDELVPETMKYLYYGPGIGVEESAAEWKNFVPTAGKKISGKDAMVISDLTCTPSEGLKEMYVKFKDGAGNVSDPTKASFYYDITQPEPEAKDVDFFRVSEAHVQRIGEATGKYCDEVHFTLDPHATIQAFKVCAYKDQNACDVGNSGKETKKYSECVTLAEKNAWAVLQVVIPTTAGSQNMSGSGLSSDATIACMIKGTDFKTALGTAGDGLHYVVVYVQDLGGNWSAAAEFAI